ncbi:MAG: PorP/SprF family type IX secretion system membrane protein [Bacteroidota bacterium]
MRKIYYALLLTTISYSLLAQDPYFSQYNFAAQQTSPAMTGLFEGDLRATVNFREQWTGLTDTRAYRTLAAGIDIRKPFLKRDYMSFGVNVLRDEAQGTSLVEQQAVLSYAYAKHLGGNPRRRTAQYLIVAAQGGIGQRNLERGNLWFSNQYDADSGTIDDSIDANENINAGRSDLYANANAGLMWYAVYARNRSLYLGGSIHHLTRPNVSLYEETTQTLPLRYSIQVGGELPLSRNLSLLPSLFSLHQGKAMTVIGGGSFRYNSRDFKEVALRMGLWGQVGNRLDSGLGLSALIVGAALEMTNVQFGLSYDITTSSIAQLNGGRGAFELSVTYIKASRGRRVPVSCPKF